MSAEPIVVVGAGPVGLCAALRIAQCGARVLVLEKRASLTRASKASTLHPPTLEILHALGVWRPGAQGEIVRAIQFRDGAEQVADLDMSLLAAETAFPFRLHLEQAEITPVLLQKLNEHPNAEVRFDMEASGLELNDDGVSLICGQERVLASFVLGCDGARSAVRQAIGASFEGADYASRVLRLMTKARLEALIPGLAPLTYLFAGAESCSLLKMPDCWRIILRAPSELDDATLLDPQRLDRELEKFLPVPRAELGELVSDVFSVGKRVASTYVAGRVLLAGDAAHITNTRGGMNMNCGIHDAWTLGARLAQAWIDGDAASVIAAAQHRRAVAREQLLPRTDRSVIGGTSWLEQVRGLTRDEAAARAYLREAAMLDMTERPVRPAC